MSMNRKIRFSWLGSLVLLLAAVLSWQPSAQGQGQELLWSAPVTINLPGDFSAFPTLLADSAGRLHAFWTTVDNPESSTGLSVLYYARWSGSSWSTPVDILASPESNPAARAMGDLVAVVLDSAGYFHASWVGGNGYVYHSMVPLDQAGSAHSWSPPQAVALDGLSISGLAARDNTIHLAYTRSPVNSGVSYSRSTDGGFSWSPPSDISGPLESDHLAHAVRIAVDGRGRVHVVWHENLMPGNWPPVAAKYMRSPDGGDTWTSPVALDTCDPDKELCGVSFANVLAIGPDEIHLFWDGRPTFARQHKYSTDGGVTWSPPEHIFPELMGSLNGPTVAAVDSAGRIYAVASSGTTGVLCSVWHNGTWSPSMTVATLDQSPDPHYQTIAMVAGNEIHIAWHDVGPIYYTKARTDAPRVAPVPVPTGRISTTGPTVTPTVVATPLPAPTPPPSLTPKPVPTTTILDPVRIPPNVLALVVGVAPVLLLVALLIVVRASRRNR